MAKEDYTTTTTSYDFTRNASFSRESYHDSKNPGTPFDIAMDCLLVYALVLAVYLVVVLSYHEWVLRRNGTSGGRSGARICKIRIAPWLRILCIISAVFCLLRCINDVIYYKTLTMSDIPCTVLKNMGVSWLVGVDTSVYLFLWLRQKVLYQKRSMRQLANPFLSFVSWFALVLIFSIFIVMNVLLLLRKYSYNAVLAECKKEWNPAVAVTPKLFTVSSTILHILLVGLCVYPLIQHTVKQRQVGTPIPKANQGTSKMLQKNGSAPFKGPKSLMPVIVRCVVISLICVLTDGITIAIAEHWITADELTKLRHFLYDINILINVFAIVGSFKNWRLMLFPCWRWKANEGSSDGPKRDSLFTSTTMSPNAIHHLQT